VTAQTAHSRQRREGAAARRRRRAGAADAPLPLRTRASSAVGRLGCPDIPARRLPSLGSARLLMPEWPALALSSSYPACCSAPHAYALGQLQRAADVGAMSMRAAEQRQQAGTRRKRDRAAMAGRSRRASPSGLWHAASPASNKRMLAERERERERVKVSDGCAPLSAKPQGSCLPGCASVRLRLRAVLEPSSALI
jgi:hypothetical protein